MATSRPHLLTLLCSLFLLVTPSLQQQCYYPNGQPVKPGSLGAAVACPGVDSCCIQGDVCFTGGMCFSSENGAVYRGFCTDKSWSSDSTCASQCSSSSLGTEFMWVKSCGGAQSCCAGTNSTADCCDDSDEFFWNFTPLNLTDGASTTPQPTGPVSQTTTVVATVTSTDTMIAYGTAGVGKSGSVLVSTTTVTANSGASGRCEGVCELVTKLASFALLWL